jgi:hypothetical protein
MFTILGWLGGAPIATDDGILNVITEIRNDESELFVIECLTPGAM